MFYHVDKQLEEPTAPPMDHQLVLDGTVNLDYSSEDELPRVRGLIELINDYFNN